METNTTGLLMELIIAILCMNIELYEEDKLMVARARKIERFLSYLSRARDLKASARVVIP